MQTTLVFFSSQDDSYKGILRGAVAFISLILCDLIWFSLTKKSLYTPTIQNVTQRTDNPFRIGGGLFAWLLLASAIAVQMPKTIEEAAVYGALVGLVIYGVFNMTNYAIFKDWSLTVSAVDTMWGICNCCSAAVIVYLIFHQSST